MNAWTCGLSCSFLALASLVGAGGTQPIGPPSKQQVNEKASAGRQAAVPNGRVLVARFPHGPKAENDDAAVNLTQVYEDIEIYRSLLSKTIAPYVADAALFAVKSSSSPQSAYHARYSQKLEKVYSGSTITPVLEQFYVGGQTDPHANLAVDSLRIDGVYLPPMGIVLTAEVPGKIPIPVAEKTEARTKPLTEWERARRELRGEKLDAPVAPTRQEQSHLFLDSILHSLANNGHNLRLAPDQNVTIVLTTRPNGMQQCQSCHTNASNTTAGTFSSGLPGESSMLGTFFQPNAGQGQPQANSAFNPPGARLAQAELFRQPGRGSNDSAQNDQALLGDLHFKQGRYDEAAAAYHKAIKELPIGRVDAWAMNPTPMSPEFRSVVLKLIELQNRIIQCELALKQEDKVHRSFGDLKRWMAVLESIDPKADGGKAASSNKAKTTRPSLPDKLIVVASKALLDQVGKHQISFDEFKAKVKVEFVKLD